ncbi:MAG: hypothetical protein BA872_05320 [Desulfobacterales bacterium C00003060]|nr:MAG: hypothetical protein BA872_05320 [Desulfobacterales bacterium C00003060]
MRTTKIAEEIESLPVEAQKEVIDFVAFLKTRYPVVRTIRKHRQTKLSDEPFIGMWRGREDMRNSVAWVKSLRQREWGRRL